MAGAAAVTVLVNLTSHPIDVVDPVTGDVVLRLDAASQPARAAMTTAVVDQVHLGGVVIPVHRNRVGDPSPLPEPLPDVRYVVSRTFAEAAVVAGLGRSDLLIPDDTIRGADGRIAGCRAFAVID